MESSNFPHNLQLPDGGEIPIDTLMYYDGPISYIQKLKGGYYFMLWVDYSEDKDGVETDTWIAARMTPEERDYMLTQKDNEAYLFRRAIEISDEIYIIKWDSRSRQYSGSETVKFEDIPEDYLPYVE